MTAPGKVRAFGYTLCEGCKSLPDPSPRIEDVILARWERETAGVCTN